MAAKKPTVYEYFKETADKYSARTALIYNGAVLDFAEFLSAVDKTASDFTNAGVRAGDTVSVCMPNTVESAAAFYALSKLGCVMSAVHPLTPELQLREYLTGTGSKFLYNGTLTAVKSPSVKIPEGVSVLLHSGGTTGKPKTVMLTDKNFNALTDRLLYMLDLDGAEQSGGKISYSVLPFFHGYGLAIGLHAFLRIGAAVYIEPRFTPERAADAVKNYNVSVFTGVPAMYGALLSCPAFGGAHLKNVQNAFVGADFLPEEIREKFDNLMKKYGSEARLAEGYGLTETVTVNAVNTARFNKAGSVGRSIPGMSAAVWDAEKGFLRAGEVGEILISGPTVMRGYLNAPDVTAEALRTHGGKVWVHTGDCGYIDADGYLYFKQRIKRVIKIAGISVFPSEIEEAASASGLTLAVCAVRAAKGKHASAVRLHVILKPGIAPDKETEKTLLDFMAKRLIKYALPSQIVFEKFMPTTPLGKIDYKKLEDGIL